MRGQPFELRGAAAVKYLDALGRTGRVAANASLTATDLVEELQHDPLMFVTSDGMVGYTEPAVPLSALGADAEAAAVAEPIAVDVWSLHSRPSSTTRRVPRLRRAHHDR